MIYVHRLNGKIEYAVTDSLDNAMANFGSGYEYLESSEVVATDKYKVDQGQLVELPPKPNKFCVYDYDANIWVDPRTIQNFKDAKWVEIKAARSAAEYGGFAWDGSTFDSDAASQQRIIGASQLASLNPSAFEIDWTLADNTVRTLSAADMQAVGVALGQHVNGQYVHARTLREQIEAAATKEEVDAISW